jgi:hypothetical protein
MLPRVYFDPQTLHVSSCGNKQIHLSNRRLYLHSIIWRPLKVNFSLEARA